MDPTILPDESRSSDAPSTGQRLEIRHASPPATFEAFFEEHHVRLFSTMCLVAESRAEAEDIAQDAFVKIFERWERVRTHENPPGYLYRTAFNLLRNRHRSALGAARRVFFPPEVTDAYEQIDDRGALVDALRALSVRQRAAVVLTDLLDYPSQEAAKMLGVRPVTVRVLASQARAHLRVSLELPDE